MFDTAAATMIVESRVTDPPLELVTTPEAFRPNPVTVRFARAVRIKPGDVVFDLGTGIGPLAIKAALDGASVVHAVDPVEMHCALARLNAERHGVADRVVVHHGEFFEPLESSLGDGSSMKADVIIGDVSGIADGVARGLGWYSEQVPTGGPDGADPIVALLHQAPRFLKPGGTLYFPVANDLSDADRILETANRIYGSVVNTSEKEYFEFPLSAAEVAAIASAYPDGMPSFITIQEGRRPFWRGQILAAQNPR